MHQKLQFISSIYRLFGFKSIDELIGLHLICNSSKKVYGARDFIKVENDNGVRIRLVHARFRVAHL